MTETLSVLYRECPVTLICTVGGSPQPIRTALADLRPDRVLFAVSKEVEGSRSSRSVVEDALQSDGQPGLRHSPGCPDAVIVREIPPDDPDAAFALLEAEIDRLRCDSVIVVDYTGGTKSMSSALFLAATAHEGVRLQFMKGARTDLIRVEPGTEKAVELPVHLIGVARDLDMAREFVAMRDYAAARTAVDSAQTSIGKRGGRKGSRAPAAWVRRIELWKRWLKCFDSWDRFDHRGARSVLEQGRDVGSQIGQDLDRNGYGARLEQIALAAGQPSFLLVEDLWLNALRRGSQGRYDDAVARCYRLVEAALQAHIFDRFGLDTGCVPPEEIPEEMRAEVIQRQNRKTGEAYVELGLASARRFLEVKDQTSPVVTALGDGPIPWQGQRNRSILAHGFRQLDATDWKSVERWFVQRQAVWEAPLGRRTAEQLPNSLP